MARLKIIDTGFLGDNDVANDSQRLCERCQCVGYSEGGVMEGSLLEKLSDWPRYQKG